MGCGASRPTQDYTDTSSSRVLEPKPVQAPKKCELRQDTTKSSNLTSQSSSIPSTNGSKPKHKSKSPPLNALLLGAGESGKSTVFKQMRLSYGDALSHFERTQFAKLIWIDTLKAMRTILSYLDETNELVDLLDRPHLNELAATLLELNVSRQLLVSSEQDAKASEFLSQHLEDDISQGPSSQYNAPSSVGSAIFEPEIKMRYARAIRGLYDEFLPVRRCLIDPSYLSLDPNTEYFISKVMEIAEPGYLASDDDVLRARIKTVSIEDALFDIKGNTLRVVDVGGQRSERRKWAQSCDNVNCVMFVSALSEFDQTLMEDDRVNRLRESMEVFRQTVESKWFAGKPVALFLNKLDLFEQKLQRVSFKKYFPEFQGDERSASDVLAFVEGEFRRRLKRKNLLYIYNTSATDRGTMKFVVTAVTDMIFMEGMMWSGLL